MWDCPKCKSEMMFPAIFLRDFTTCPRCKTALPPETEEEYERRLWKENQEKERKKHKINPLLGYAVEINGTVPNYEISFEKHNEISKEHTKRRREDDDENLNEILEDEARIRLAGKIRRGEVKPPNGMTKTQWLKEHSRKRKEYKESLEQYWEDFEIKHDNPINMLVKMLRGGLIGYRRMSRRKSRRIDIDGIEQECRCTAADMRQGRYCKVCTLITKVWEYAVGIFKDAAEGRSPYV
jgi:DNA-directed RNA polymerase subunit M/transcription elongation factor TFIIS